MVAKLADHKTIQQAAKQASKQRALSHSTTQSTTCVKDAYVSLMSGGTWRNWQTHFGIKKPSGLNTALLD
jgi:hypothetical protein